MKVQQALQRPLVSSTSAPNFFCGAAWPCSSSFALSSFRFLIKFRSLSLTSLSSELSFLSFDLERLRLRSRLRERCRSWLPLPQAQLSPPVSATAPPTAAATEATASSTDVPQMPPPPLLALCADAPQMPPPPPAPDKAGRRCEASEACAGRPGNGGGGGGRGAPPPRPAQPRCRAPRLSGTPAASLPPLADLSSWASTTTNEAKAWLSSLAASSAGLGSSTSSNAATAGARWLAKFSGRSGGAAAADDDEADEACPMPGAAPIAAQTAGPAPMGAALPKRLAQPPPLLPPRLPPPPGAGAPPRAHLSRPRRGA
mmetsp:Transcript_178713/g.567090  ORF Transcript_178713/g.567090 Transcript_178713/m.567090 type:complete len:314 (+) Transcript_178713:1263-2204(+)